MQQATYASIVSKLRKRIIDKWSGNSHSKIIFRNMAMLAFGSAGAKAVSLLAVPVITRIYTPEHFGVLSVFTALISLLVPFGTLQYSMALPLPKQDQNATNLAVLCACSLLLFSLLTTIFFWFFAPYLLERLTMHELLPFWWLIPIAVIGSGIYEILNNWAIREKAFTPLARTRVWQAIIGSITKIGLGLLGLKPLGLLIGHVFNQTGGIFSLAYCFFSKFKNNWFHVSRKRLWSLFITYADFPKFRLPSQVLMLLALKAPLLFLAWHFGPEITGQFGLAMMVLSLPLTLFVKNTSQAYYAEIARMGPNRSDEIYRITINISKKLLFVGIPPFVILILSGPWLFEFVFGEAWREAGFFASILTINLLTMFVVNPISNALTVVGKQAYYLQINFVRLVLIIIVFFLTYSFDLNIYLTLIFYSLAMSLQRILVYWRVLYLIKAYGK